MQRFYTDARMPSPPLPQAQALRRLRSYAIACRRIASCRRCTHPKRILLGSRRSVAGWGCPIACRRNNCGRTRSGPTRCAARTRCTHRSSPVRAGRRTCSTTERGGIPRRRRRRGRRCSCRRRSGRSRRVLDLVFRSLEARTCLRRTEAFFRLCLGRIGDRADDPGRARKAAALDVSQAAERGLGGLAGFAAVDDLVLEFGILESPVSHVGARVIRHGRGSQENTDARGDQTDETTFSVCHAS